MTIQNPITEAAETVPAKERKRAARRREIADNALKVLKKQGCGQTTLRDIATQSGLSLGLIHYYFDSREDLLIYCVQHYKETFVARMQAAMGAHPTSPQGLRRAFCEALVDAIEFNADRHVLWYDILSLAQFDSAFVPIVREIEDLMKAQLEPLLKDPSDMLLQAGMYARLDGVFRYLLQNRTQGIPMSRADMVSMFDAAIGA